MTFRKKIDIVDKNRKTKIILTYTRVTKKVTNSYVVFSNRTLFFMFLGSLEKQELYTEIPFLKRST